MSKDVKARVGLTRFVEAELAEARRVLAETGTSQRFNVAAAKVQKLKEWLTWLESGRS